MSLERPHNAFCVVTENPEDTLNKFNHRSRGCIGKAAKRRHWKSWRSKLRKHRREARWVAKSQRLIDNGIAAIRSFRAAQKLLNWSVPSAYVDEDVAASSKFKGMNGTIVPTKIFRQKFRTMRPNNIQKFDSSFLLAVGNVRTLCGDHRLYELVNEAINLKLGLLALIEHRRIIPEAWAAPHDIGRGWKWLILSAAKGADGIHGSTGGIGLLISPQWARVYAGFTVIDGARALVVTFDGKFNKFHAVVIYAHPATCADNVASNKILFAAVAAHIEAIPKGDMVVTLLDANATVTTDGESDYPVKRVLYGPNRVQINRNSSVFREFLEDSDNFPLNCRFRQPRYATFWSPNGRTAQ